MGQRADTITPRQRMVLQLLAEGATAKKAARELGISPRTVEKHIEQAKLKLRAANRVHLIGLALTGGVNLRPASDG